MNISPVWILLLSFLSACAHADRATPIYQNPRAPLEARVQDALSRLTLEEKIDFLSGTGFDTRANTRLGIPAILMADGPVGIRSDRPTTAFPSGISMAATFDPELVKEIASAMARETKALGKDMLLGPCIDISRNPFGGRNFESFGEDPFLTSQITREYLKGIQALRVIPSTKHYAMNDQEHKRFTINVVADERTMHEIHLPAFHEAVKSGTWTIMAAYNKINGHWASENQILLTDILKEKWGFKGLVVSDWDATHSTVKAAKAGLDLEMPTGKFFGPKLLEAVRAGHLSEALINDKTTRVLRVIFGSGLFDANPANRPDVSVVGGEKHLSIARKGAQESIVLLKNETVAGARVLPLQANKLQKLAVIGPGAMRGRIAGGGSSMVAPTRNISPYVVLKNRMKDVDVQHAYGVRLAGDEPGIAKELLTTAPGSSENGVIGEYFDNMKLEGKPALTRVDPTIDFVWEGSSPLGPNNVRYSVRWTGYLNPVSTGDYRFIVRTDDGARLYINDKLVHEVWTDQSDLTYYVNRRLESGKSYKIRLEYYQNTGGAVAVLGLSKDKNKELQDAVDLAAKSDAVILFAGTTYHQESEGQDRASIALTNNQDELIKKVAKANPNTIVVINAGNPVTMPWVRDVSGIIYAGFPGQEGAEAIADILMGDVNPSGKLPVSFPKSWKDAAAYGAYPEDPGFPERVTYKEGIYVGYRHFDTFKVEPLFPFGFGLSYTTFQYSNLNVQVMDPAHANPAVEVSLAVTNSGKVDGQEVVQLYVSEEKPSVKRPFQELKGFQKIHLAAGETKQVKFSLDASSFAFYDVKTHDWKVDAASFTVRVGSSSRETPLSAKLQLQ